MNDTPLSPEAAATPHTATRRIAQIAVVLVLAALAANAFLISPPPGQTYPGAVPWNSLSVLRPLTQAMSIGGAAVSVRGVEVKDFAFHLAAVIALILLAARLWFVRGTARLGRAGTAAVYAQLLLAGWVAISLASSLWSGDPDLAAGQAVLYALALLWAVTLAHLLRREHLPIIVGGIVVISTLTAGLCIWYYYERNPFHRPGFPIGNPNMLAASLLPALLTCTILVARALVVGVSTQNWRTATSAAGGAAVIALVPLLWCSLLTNSRGATLAGVAGLAIIIVYVVGRRRRWYIAGLFAVAIVASGIGLYYASRLDATMGRGPTVRFRLYAWRYAAELWDMSPFIGQGAGCYPRLAGQFAVMDQALDPGAFMAVLVEHAHNELFEVLAEIGLIGGLTFVGGIVAIFYAAAALLRPTVEQHQRWLLLALISGITALLADSLVGVTFRLPGVNPIFYTLLGTLWALCRTTSETDRPAPSSAPAPRPVALRWGATGVCLLAAIATGTVVLRDWGGVQHEHRAFAAFDAGDYTAATQQAGAAEPGLLDPVRKLAVRDLALRSRLAHAAQVVYWLLDAPPGTVTKRAWQAAVDELTATYNFAVDVRLTGPALPYTDARIARVAQWLGELHYGAGQTQLGERWLATAQKAWARQRGRTPYDAETLLALTRFPAPLTTHVALLRDALRFLDTLPADAESERLYQLWQLGLQHFAVRPQFGAALAGLIATAGPISPQTAPDSIIDSTAPETHRLHAAWLALQGDFMAAAEASARAAALYAATHRFPVQQARALAEQAEYTFRASPHGAQDADELMQRAIDALPEIQEQQYAVLAAPFRARLAQYQLAGGHVDAARATLALLYPADADRQAAMSDAYVQLAERFIRRPAADRPGVDAWLAAALQLTPTNFRAWSWQAWLAAEAGDLDRVTKILDDAAAAGVPAEGIAAIRRSLCREFPGLCVPLGVTSPTSSQSSQ